MLDATIVTAPESTAGYVKQAEPGCGRNKSDFTAKIYLMLDA